MQMNRTPRCGLTLVAGGMLAVAGLLTNPTIAESTDIDPHGGMLRYPDVSQSQIVFLYANDLWIAPRTGGMASPLSSPDGVEQFPRFSPDGKSIAFTGNYGGNRDLYTLSNVGGIPHRVTHHPANERLDDWTTDGRLLFSSNGLSGLGRMSRLFLVNPEGGLPEALPVPYGADGAVSSDGEWLAYTPYQRDFRTWKRYMGGMASDIWLFNLRDHSARKVTDWGGTDTMPMWHGRTLYYLSDAGPAHRLNIWKYNPQTRRREQVTRHRDFDVKWPSMGPGPNRQGEIVYQLGPDLMLLNLANGRSNSVKITIPGDRPSLRDKRVDANDFMSGAGISATGKRAVTSARGDIWTLPAENGSPRNLTRSSDAAERYPSWSPDGRWIAYFADNTGEYEMYITQSDGKGETRQVTDNGGDWRFDAIWSPDSTKILMTEKDGEMYLVDVESGEQTLVDTEPGAFAGPGADLNWSHDSRWIVYARSGDVAWTQSIWLYNVETGERTQVTSGTFNDFSPTFDRKGDYIYFASQRSFQPTYSEIDTTFIYEDADVLMAVPLRADVEHPWLPEIDEEEWDTDDEGDEADEDSDDEGDDENGDDEAEDAAPDDGLSGTWKGTATFPEMGDIDVTMSLTLGSDGTVTGSMSSMIASGTVEGTYDAASGKLRMTMEVDGTTVQFELTVKGDSMTGVATADGERVEINAERTGGGGDDGDDDGDEDEAAEEVIIELEGFEARAFMIPIGNGNYGNLAVNNKNQLLYVHRGQGIKLFDIDDDDQAAQSVNSSAGGFDISADGKKLLIGGGGGLSILNASAGASPKSVTTSGMITHVDLDAEWRQMLHDVYLIYRNFFYVENMHGVDWKATHDQYAAMIDDCIVREDLQYVIAEMISELNAGHAYSWGGDTEGQASVPTAMLGVDFELDGGAYRIREIFEGAAWDVDARNPLRVNGIDVKEGEYILAVDGIPMDTSKDPWAAFVDKNRHPVTLTVGPSPEIDDESREVTLDLMGGDGNLRYRAWIEANRRYVEEQTDGRIGYIYVPDTGVNGQNNLLRQFYGQIHKEGLIIDERWNGGGQIPTRFIELLNRPHVNYWGTRDSRDWPWPPDSHQGPKCMLINGLAGSGGDAFPHYFKQAGLGKLIGMRTWGGLIGISGNPGLVDGGYTSVPTFGFYDMDGTWGIEGHGVDPDIEVIDDPSKMVDGGDPQLDAAIAHMLEEIEKNGYKAPKRPADPNRKGMGITEADK